MRVLVCGGRDYNNYDRINQVLGGLHHGTAGPITCVIEGGASGADRMAFHWSRNSHVEEHESYDALWDDLTIEGAVVKNRPNGRWYNVMAGFQRNQRMIDEGRPDLVVAFPGGNGTADMVARARAARIPVLEVNNASD